MGDVQKLRSTLLATDGTAPSIQSSASSMMKMYDKSPSLAVAEWRNVLQTCSDSQLLPLLYVANEVLQISKRNRGNKYLESFSPILGGALKLICERDTSVTEKVRRTAKIWGDRRIFSARFVGDLLVGLENYRHGMTAAADSTTATIQQSRQQQMIQQPSNNDNDNDSFTLEDPRDNQQGSKNNDDEDDPFGNSGPSLLNVSNFSVDKKALQRDANGMKRRRDTSTRSNDDDITNLLNQSNDKISKQKGTKRKMALTTSNLVELVDQLSHLHAESRDITRSLSSIASSKLCTATDEVNEVGDELFDLHTEITSTISKVKKEKRVLFHIAEGKKNIENEFKRYLLWMKDGLNVDVDELKFCNDLEKKLTLLQLVHGKSFFLHCILMLLSYLTFFLN